MSSKVELFLLVLKEQLQGIHIAEVVISIIIAGFITAGFVLANRKSRNKINITDVLLVFWSTLWFEITLIITIIQREPGSEYHNGNIVPYLQFGSLYDKYSQKQIIYNLFNVLLFIPIGFLIMAWKRSSAIKDIIISIFTGFIFSFSIEVAQLLTKRGSFELSDIVTNCVGTCLGILVCNLLMRIYRNGKI